MTLRAYQTLYESSVAFGMRKALMAEQGKSELERKVRHRWHYCYFVCYVFVF
jgi:dynein light intermediate chain